MKKRDSKRDIKTDREREREKKKIKTERETAQGAETSAQVYNDDAVGEEWDKKWRSRLLAWSLHLSPGVSEVSQGWRWGWGEKGLAGRGEGCGRLGDGVCQLNIYPRGQANSKWGVFVIKAVYQLSNQQKQNLATRKLRMGSGVVYYRFAPSGKLCNTLS